MLGIKEQLESLRSQSRNYRGRRNHVSLELKIQAVDEYLQGKATITDLSKNIRLVVPPFTNGLVSLHQEN